MLHILNQGAGIYQKFPEIKTFSRLTCLKLQFIYPYTRSKLVLETDQEIDWLPNTYLEELIQAFFMLLQFSYIIKSYDYRIQSFEHLP